MIIIEDNRILDDGTVVALGNFDGVHIGHKELLIKAKERAEKINRKLVVITFNEKLTQKKNRGVDCKIMSFKQKCKVLKSMGVDILYILDFNQELRNMSREDFVKDILINKVRAEEIFIGFNFKFGKNAEGDASYLKNGGFKFKVNIIDAVEYKDKIVSSSLIRDYIKSGNIEEVNEILIVPFTISGKVIRGKGRGKHLGFATANLKCDDKYINPKFGVYETRTVYKGKEYKSLTNVGENPTFGDIDLFSIETHLLGFDDDIYDENIDVEFVRFMRGEVKFTTVTNLITQVKSDISSILFAKEK
ncbi:MAG: bifunctional riboflavin kinase/FAD synthetase [Andreesenia angusta]|nr:bifunctional riboflavin kinase/FAD synthetase [Andreesenia angusta]